MNVIKSFTPFDLAGLRLRNRFIKTATYEGLSKRGVPSEEFIEFHRRTAEGGVAMTTVAYGAVNEDGLTNENQMVIDRSSVPFLSKLARAVHDEGAAVSLQLTHCGYFTRSTRYNSRRPLAPSTVINKYGLLRGRGISKPMRIADLRKTREDYTRAAEVAAGAGFDAVEIHLGHGYLLSQFLTPGINRRRDIYGGALENRARFPLEVVKAVKSALGINFPVICKVNMDDGFPKGLVMEESLVVAGALRDAGADALLLSGGYTSRTPFYLMRGEVPLGKMVRAEKHFLQKMTMAFFGRLIIGAYPFKENFFLGMAEKFRKNIDLPLIYVGGISSAEGISEVMDKGFDLVAVGRALIHDPDFIEKVRRSPLHVSECNRCNECVAEMDRGGIRCTLHDAL